MTLKLRFLRGVDPLLKKEMVVFGKWLRGWYSFPLGLEIRLVHQAVLVDSDGVESHLRWWQTASGRPVLAEIAVGSFAKNLAEEGPEVAFPTVVAAIARVVKYYYQVVRDAPVRDDLAERWGDKVLEAYVKKSQPPPPWSGAPRPGAKTVEELPAPS